MESDSLLSLRPPRLRHVVRIGRRCSSAACTAANGRRAGRSKRSFSDRTASRRRVARPPGSAPGIAAPIPSPVVVTSAKVIPFDRAAAALGRKLTVRARRDHNNSRAGSPHHQRRAQRAPRWRRAAGPRRRPAQVSVRTQHRQAAGLGPVRRRRAAPAFPRDRDIVVYDSDPNELASSDVAAQLIRRAIRPPRSRAASSTGSPPICRPKRKRRRSRRRPNPAH